MSSAFDYVESTVPGLSVIPGDSPPCGHEGELGSNALAGLGEGALPVMKKHRSDQLGYVGRQKHCGTCQFYLIPEFCAKVNCPIAD
jgi:hypothetical protein